MGLVLIDAVDADDLAGLDAHLRWSVSWGAVNPDWWPFGPLVWLGAGPSDQLGWLGANGCLWRTISTGNNQKNKLLSVFRKLTT